MYLWDQWEAFQNFLPRYPYWAQPFGAHNISSHFACYIHVWPLSGSNSKKFHILWTNVCPPCIWCSRCSGYCINRNVRLAGILCLFVCMCACACILCLYCRICWASRLRPTLLALSFCAPPGSNRKPWRYCLASALRSPSCICQRHGCLKASPDCCHEHPNFVPTILPNNWLECLINMLLHVCAYTASSVLSWSHLVRLVCS